MDNAIKNLLIGMGIGLIIVLVLWANLADCWLDLGPISIGPFC